MFFQYTIASLFFVLTSEGTYQPCKSSISLCNFETNFSIPEYLVHFLL
jgi:hypothetical protein